MCITLLFLLGAMEYPSESATVSDISFSEKAKALTHSIIGFAGILPIPNRISGQQGKNTFGQKFFYDLNLLSAEKSNMM